MSSRCGQNTTHKPRLGIDCWYQTLGQFLGTFYCIAHCDIHILPTFKPNGVVEDPALGLCNQTSGVTRQNQLTVHLNNDKQLKRYNNNNYSLFQLSWHRK